MRPIKRYSDQLPGYLPECKIFRLVDVSAAAKAEDCYAMWCYWNEDPEKYEDIDETQLRFNLSDYLYDTELQQALKKITNADEMEVFLKAKFMAEHKGDGLNNLEFYKWYRSKMFCCFVPFFIIN